MEWYRFKSKRTSSNNIDILEDWIYDEPALLTEDVRDWKSVAQPTPIFTMEEDEMIPTVQHLDKGETVAGWCN